MEPSSPVGEPTNDELVRHYLANPLSRSIVMGQASERLTWHRSDPMYPSRESLERYYAAAQAVLIETQGSSNRAGNRPRYDRHAEYTKRLSYAGNIQQLALDALNTLKEVTS